MGTAAGRQSEFSLGGGWRAVGRASSGLAPLPTFCSWLSSPAGGFSQDDLEGCPILLSVFALSCGVSRQRPPPSRCGSAGCLALAASFLSSAWVFPLCCGTPANRKRKRTRDHKTGRGFSNTTSPSIFVRSSFSGQGCTDTICIAAPFSLGMLKTSETSGGPAPHPPSQDDVLLANMFRIRCRFSLPHGNTLLQAFRCLAAPGDSPSRLFQPSRLQ